MGSYKADESSGMVLLAGNSHPELARLVSDRLNVKLGDAIVYNKTNRETTVDIKQSVRGKHVFIIQSGSNKQCRMLRRSAIPMKLIADMMCKSGAMRMVSLDLYKKEIQGFFSIPVDNLRASPFLLQYIKENIPDYKNAVIVAKSPGVMNKATSYADRLRLVRFTKGEPTVVFEWATTRMYDEAQ
ncbi:Phosphoribosyl pyrophosphate synthase-associated protein 2 [Toxocara canis]|uniref:Phosphoribosyl pyrophosphate synthase-associated protein 2 n=1 Tax=Toxocara canis TaxID=6265 RepID=A0A0B2VVB0_TOXCA|nr:Phosphoribosyl pyrophosphate synthase-associated protein 2 [Toxocara canis]